MNLGDQVNALGWYEKALEINNDYAPAINNLANLKKQSEGEALHKEAIRLHIQGDIKNAENLYRQAIDIGFLNETTFSNLGVIYKNSERPEEAIALYKKAIEINPNDPNVHANLGNLYREHGKLDEALAFTLKSLELKPNNPDAYYNLGGIYKDLGNLDQALASTLKSLELKPDNPTAHMNLGGIYKELGNLDQALASTLKSLELKPDNPDSHSNLGGIHKDLGNLDQALASTLKSLELKADNPTALNNIKAFIDQLTTSPANAHYLTKAYEVLINSDNITHQKLSTLFNQAFLPTIQEATKSDPLISADNNALNNLVADWRLRKSLTLLIPPHQDIENFLIDLRKEILILAANHKSIPKYLKPFTEALATQCFLNEYVYAQSPEEEELVNWLIKNSRVSQDLFNQYLAIIACYKPIHQLNLSSEWLKNYPRPCYESRALLQTQLEEPKKEERIKVSIQSGLEIADAISLKVQAIYEANPYPRYRHADHTHKSLTKKISEIIKLESTTDYLPFSEALSTNHAQPKVLIAGCGTGNQVIAASRYKNAQITSIDLSRSSLAYAIRKTQEYKMNNVSFKKMDLLDVIDLSEKFDTIECSGVLHHMENPAKGLTALNNQLKPNGYIKLGLYSEIARHDITKARNRIKQLGLKSTVNCIKEFRQQVLQGEFKELTNLPNFGRDFYSLSEFRDLCFHVQEHLFTTESLQALLDNHGLIFCGFILPESILKVYKEQFPDDSDMTNLNNWGRFEEQQPTTFSGMYQFWAYKPS
ncbi:class I SAM-dependent methyltransferase [Prochlorococcus marinus]|uniref:class I SAM-dependent methyltransferase n=1 Tax=Prochlorococcus marinus TaxID=1219 RepID=UPI001F25C8EC|nr:class I SAM-dependent methyltransferase [Prochlorococcus marinus]